MIDAPLRKLTGLSAPMKTKLRGCGAGLLAVLSLAGCGGYRTNSDIKFSSTFEAAPVTDITISQGALEDRKYRELGKVKAKVKKSSAFSPNPTRAQANVVLAEKARELGADAVIRVTYEWSVGPISPGIITATGIAVKLERRPRDEAR